MKRLILAFVLVLLCSTSYGASWWTQTGHVATDWSHQAYDPTCRPPQMYISTSANGHSIVTTFNFMAGFGPPSTGQFQYGSGSAPTSWTTVYTYPDTTDGGPWTVGEVPVTVVAAFAPPSAGVWSVRLLITNCVWISNVGVVMIELIP